MKHLLSICAFAALAAGAQAQNAVELKQVSMGRWGIGSAQYSGIAPMGGNRYAVVSDKEPKDGFSFFASTSTQPRAKSRVSISKPSRAILRPM